ncbi:hypothetical protein GGQ84_002583 [Desulfitispora alkaliphila]|uniref:YfcE family phosphodiesterase n=1 Tax=Desulfitispora alkaliphila TaxID=622674 RepID=UPI003D1FD0B7
MERILIVSDTHGELNRIKKHIESSEKEIDFIIHAGDNWKDGLQLADYVGTEVAAVVGNCDPMGSASQEQLLEFDNIKVFVTHGHIYSVKQDLQRIYYRGREVEADIVVFGHTHIPFNKEIEGMHLFNPGSASEPRGCSDYSCGFLEIINDKFYIKNIDI